jgi:hypothetical protein
VGTKLLVALFVFGFLITDIRDYIFYILDHTESILKFLKVSPVHFPYAPYVVLFFASITAIKIFSKV